MNVCRLIIRDPSSQGKYSDYQEICMGLEETTLGDNNSVSYFSDYNGCRQLDVEMESEEKEVGSWFRVSKHAFEEKITIYNEYGSVFNGVEYLDGVYLPSLIDKIYIISYVIQEDGNNCIIKCTF